MSSINQAAGGCGCAGAPTCAVAISGNVKGCGGFNLAGATVEAHDATTGGPLLGTTTTDSGGNYTLAGLAGTATHAIVMVFKKARLTQATTTLTYNATTGGSTLWSCGKTSTPVSKTLSTAAAGFHCTNRCADPLPDTLSLTDGMYGGPTTLTWTGGGWSGTRTVGFGGCAAGCYNPPTGCPPAGAVPIQYFLDGTTLGASVSVTANVTTGCPDNSGGMTTMADRVPTTICPPALNLTYGMVPSGSPNVDALYQCTPTTFTVTE